MKMKDFLKNKKVIVAATSLMAVMILSFSLTLALSKDVTDDVVNTFTVEDVETELNEIIDGMNKQPFVTNVGRGDCYVRVRVDISPSDLGIELLGLPVGLPGEDWELGKDGFYYYKNPLKPGETTSYLFTEVQLPADWYVDGDRTKDIIADKFVQFDIGLYHDAVQTVVYDGDEKITDMYKIWEEAYGQEPANDK